ncbi:MAG: mechanosensitive ion channel [Rickettsiales bacterium]
MNRIWTILFKPSAAAAKLMLAIITISFISLVYYDYLRLIKEFLDSESLSFNIGKNSISLYTLLKSAVTIIILFWVAGIFSEFGEKRIKKIRKIRASNKSLIIKIFQIALYFVTFIFALDILGIDLTTLTIFSGAVGIGIGFGLQKITSNFISGLILLFEKSVENDDLVELNDGTYGFIRHTGARYTLVETFEGKEIMIPNEDFITNRVTNWTYSNSKGRVEIYIRVSYESDIEKAKELILEAAREHPRCIKDPVPECFLREFADSYVSFLLHFWVDDVTLGRYEPQSDVMISMWKKFKENNITIPYPQQDLYIKNSGSLSNAEIIK